MTERNLSQPSIRNIYRGYVASRPVRGLSFPQHVQNLVIRDYAARTGLHHVLSATEYAMPSCYMMLNALLDELPKLDGIILFSIFMLPTRKARRLEIYHQIISVQCELHAALEKVQLHRAENISNIEDLIDVSQTLTGLPMHGRYEKDEKGLEDRLLDPFWSTLSALL